MQAFTRLSTILESVARSITCKRSASNLRLAPELLARSTGRYAIAKMSSDCANNQETSSENRNSVYVQYSENTDMMTISFEHTSNGKTKSFNLYRKSNEPLSASLERLKLNLLKLKKVKKPKNGLSTEQPIRDESPNVSIHLRGSLLNPDSTNNVDAWIEGATMNLDGQVYVIKRNQPQVIIMKLPSIIMKGFITVPAVDLANCDLNTCKFLWYRQISAQERERLLTDEILAKRIELKNQVYWLQLSEGITYSPTDEDVAHYLKTVCHPSDGSKMGPPYSCLSSRPVELGPPACPFEKRHSHTKDILTNSNKFRFVSYNILADLYADSEYSRKVLFAYCPPHALEIDYRRQLLLKEIKGYNADIVCLQEVDRREFIKTYEPYFKLVSGHQGQFDAKGGQVGEGVATFFRQDRFELIDNHRTVLSKLIDPFAQVEGDECSKEEDVINHPILCDLNSTTAIKLLSNIDAIRCAIKRNSELTKRFMNRHTILQTNLLRVKDVPNNFVIVANTHLYFAPDADHIRLLQGSVCVKYLEFMKSFYKSMLETKFNTSDPKISLIFCGDMNSTPDCGLFKLVHGGTIGDDLPDWRSNESEAVEGLSVETRLRLCSAYKDLSYTNYTPGFNGWLDHIYYELDGIECEGTVPMPDHDDVIASDGIPSDVFPSDHLALIANLRLNS